MPLNARLTKLERALATRPAAITAERARADYVMQLVMSDAQAHELACRLFELIDGAAFPREVQAASSALAERLNRISA